MSNNEKKFAGLEALQAFLNSCKNLFATKEKVAFIDEEDNEDVTNLDIAVSDVIIDSTLSATSTNPVQNKVVTEEFGKLQATIEKNEQDITDLTENKLDESKLGEAIDTALSQAKESGEFDGKDGYTPIKGTDYFTEAEKSEFVTDVINALPQWQGGSY